MCLGETLKRKRKNLPNKVSKNAQNRFLFFVFFFCFCFLFFFLQRGARGLNSKKRPFGFPLVTVGSDANISNLSFFPDSTSNAYLKVFLNFD